MYVLIDYGMGNLGSILNMFRRIGVPVVRATAPREIEAASKLILPGVGAFDPAMRRLRELDLLAALTERVLNKGVPLLGICLGMQLLAEASEEGESAGLGWIPGQVRRFVFPAGSNVKIPHMGWNFVDRAKSHPLTEPVADDSRFYFVHSYHFGCERPDDVLLTATYGEQPFVAAVASGHIAGVQFHPEKSHRYGMAVLRAFVQWNPKA
jgi:glutamine amidotransferase